MAFVKVGSWGCKCSLQKAKLGEVVRLDHTPAELPAVQRLQKITNIESTASIKSLVV